MYTILNIKKVSLILFVITGLIHLSTSMLIVNEVLLKQANIINKLADVPFLLTGLIYGVASLRLALCNPNKDHKTLDIILICVIILILISLILINIVIPDLKQ